MHVQALCSLQAAAAPARPCLPAPVAVLRLQHPMTRQGISPKLERGGKAGGTGLKGRKRRTSSATAAATDVLTAAPGSTKVGFLGIGIMGYAMASNLLKAGYEVTVWNRSPDKCKDLATEGAQVAASPAEVVAASDITLAMLSDPEACLAVATGPEGVAAAMAPGKGYVDVSTVDAATARQVAAAVRGAGGLYLEAPVSGSKGPAQQGQLIFLTGGDRKLYDASAPLLEVMGKASFFLGEVGAGANMKLVVNMVMGTMLASYAEGLELAKQCGLQQSDLVDVIKLGAIASPMFQLKASKGGWQPCPACCAVLLGEAPAMIEGSYPPAFPLKHQQKDLRLALALGDEVEQPLPLAAAANELYKRARAEGYSDADFSAVMAAVSTD
ncbi:Glyoxylate/succinic semialdehyde reductase 2 [Chlorella vulgaris]